MKLSTRYGLAGIGALAVLSLVHWARKLHYDGPAIIDYMIGVLPNVAAAIAIPFVLLGIWADQRPNATYAVARRSFIVVALVAGIGLIGWEFIQRSSRTLVFDLHDIGATFVGLLVGWILFTVLTPREPPAARR